MLFDVLLGKKLYFDMTYAILNEKHRVDLTISKRNAFMKKNTPKKHQNFIAKYDLEITLLADVDKTVCEAYDVWQLKKFMGREYMGVLRTSFIIGKDGRLKHIMDKVKTKSHHEDALSIVKQFGL